MKNPKVYVKKSPIHGKGLFANQLIAAGDIIGVIKGRQTSENGPYVLWLSEKQAIEVTGVLRYINHSKKPNACYCDDLTVVALKDIRAHEEVTHDYGADWV